MNFYIVMQGRTFEEEKAHEVICSSILNKKGETPHSWARMKEVEPGDFIFHYVKGEIVAISTAQDCYEEKPIPYKRQEIGYVIPTHYLPLKNPVAIKQHLTSIQPLLPIKYSAFQLNGDGNQGYLYPCNEMLALHFLELISDLNLYLDEVEQLELAIGSVISKERENELAVTLNDTVAKTHAKFRKFEKMYQKAMTEKWQHQCALCKTNVPVLLEATYSKPWKDCTDEEKLNPMNGLLLCKNHAALYKNGLIAFNGSGKIHIADELDAASYERLQISPSSTVEREEAHKPFYKWHKKHILKPVAAVDELLEDDEITVSNEFML